MSKTSLNRNGLIIDAQDLSGLNPGSENDDRLYNHDGSSSITLTNGSTVSESGYYMWDNAAGAWHPLKNASAVDSTGDTMTGNLSLGDNILNDTKSISFTDRDGGTGQYIVNEDATTGKLRVLGPTGSELTRWGEGGNFEIPGGNLIGGSTDFRIGGTNTEIQNTAGGFTLFEDDTGLNQLVLRKGGQVEAPNGNFDAAGELRLNVNGNIESLTTGNHLNFYDATGLKQFMLQEGGDAVFPNGSVTQGTNPADVITETTSPTSFEFNGDDERDIHTQTDVTISNGSTASATEDVTVELYDGVDATGTLIQSQTQSITRAAGETTVSSFIMAEEALDNGTYHIEITTSGTTLTVDQADEYTKGATYELGQTVTGNFYIQNQDGDRVLEADSVSNALTTAGDLDLGGDRIRIQPDSDFMSLTPGAKGNFTLRYDTNDFRFYNGGTGGANSVMWLRHGGDVEIPSGDLDVQGTVFAGSSVANAAESRTDLLIEDDVPQVEFHDSNVAAGGVGKRYWFHHNGGNFYLLRDDDDTGSWNGPHPLKVENSDGRVHLERGADMNNNSVTRMDQVFVNENPDTTFNLNNGAWNVIPWGTPKISDPAYTWENTNDRVKFAEAGTYKVEVNIAHNSDGSTRQNYHLQIEHYNGTWSDVGSRGLSGYMRDTEGHSHSSCHAQAIIEASAGDYVKVKSHQEADTAGSVTPIGNSTFQIEKLHR